MKAMIFAAGLGTRLRPVTDNMPKALVPVAGRPMLGRVIDKLLGAGIDGFVVNVHHFPQQIRDFIKNEYPGLDVVFSDESDMLLDTGGGILAAREWLEGDEPFVVHNADILTDFDLADMIAAHRRSDAVATLLVAERKSSRQLMFDNSGRLCGWQNSTTGEKRPAGADYSECQARAFGGVHVLSGDIFKSLRNYASGKFSIIPFYVDSSVAMPIRAYEPAVDYAWFDIGTTEKLAAAEDFMKRNS